MDAMIDKTFVGLSRAYYFRQLFFAILLVSLPLLMTFRGSGSPPFGFILLLMTNAALYPFSRFVFEGVVRFIVGENLFLIPLGFALIMQLITMVICFCFAIIIAPIGMAYCYFRQRQNE